MNHEPSENTLSEGTPRKTQFKKDISVTKHPTHICYGYVQY